MEDSMTDRSGGWVEWSSLKDDSGRAMIQIAGGYYPQELARHIAKEVARLMEEAAMSAALAAEREACAKIAEERLNLFVRLIGVDPTVGVIHTTAKGIAADIRARGSDAG